MRFERQPPLVHITASKGSSPGPCALRVRRVNLTHKVISVKIFTLSLYGCLSLDANWVSFFDRFCGFWKLSQFPRMQKILWNKIRSFERHASMFWKYFDWSQLFFCEKVRMFLVFWKFWLVTVGFLWQKVRIFLFFSNRERWTYCSVPYVPQNQSKCFQMFLRRVGSPVPKLKSPKFGGVYLYSPAPGNILCADTRAHMFLGGGRIEGFLFPCLPIYFV